MKKIITTLTAILFITNLALAQGVPSVIKASDKTPASNPCDKNVLPNDIYADFKTAIANFLGSDALKDIEKQIRDHAGGDAAAPIEIRIDDLNGFKKQYVEDTNELDPPGTAEQAENIYNNRAAYTYLTDTKENGVQVIKIKIFCKNGLRTSLIDNTESGGWKFYELLIHEFVHAKLYTMLALGVAEADLPFQDHDNDDSNNKEEGFFKEVNRLLEKLIKELKDKGLARISPVQQAEEVAISDLGISDPGLLPTNPFYFLKEMGRGLRQLLTFNPVAKARLELDTANQKAAEAKKIQEIDPANTNAIKEALKRYQTSQARLKIKLEALKETSQNPNVDRLLEQLTDLTVKHVKLLDSITRKLEDRADLRELTREAKEKIEESAAAAAQKDDPAKFATRLEQALIQSKGSDLKHVRSVEIIERIQDKATGDLREPLEKLRREFTAKLGEDIKKKFEKDGESAVRSGIEQLPGDTARFSIILKEVETGLKGRAKEVVGRVAEVLEKTTLEEAEVSARNGLRTTIRKTGSQGDYFPTQNFKLEIDGVTAGSFKEISGIESETEIIEIKDGDDMTTHKRPGRTKYSNIILKRGFINDPAFWDWYKKVVSGTTERKSGSVIVLDRAGQEVNRYNFSEAWPCKWKGPALDTKGDTRMVEELELCVGSVESGSAPSPKQVPDRAYEKKLEDLGICGPQPGAPGNWVCKDGKWQLTGESIKPAAVEPKPIEPLSRPVEQKSAVTEPATVAPAPAPTTVAPTPVTPAFYEFKLEADDLGFYPDPTITVPKGSRVKIHFIVRTANVYYGGLDFRSSKFKTETVKPGGITNVEFIADESFAFTSYWPLSDVQKASGKVVAQ